MINSVLIQAKSIVPLKKSFASQKHKLKYDTFVKNINNVSFKGKEVQAEKSDFVKWAEKTDFINTQLIDIIRNPENVIGSGFVHTAYSIPQNEEYVLRVESDALPYIDFKNINKAKIEDVEDKDLDINIGQAVANIVLKNDWDDPYTVINVLKKQTGESVGVQPAETLSKDGWGIEEYGILPYYDITRKEKYARTIHQVAELPVESYEKLLSTFQKACDAGYIFDHKNSNNILVDSNTKSFNLIDLNKGFKKPTNADFMKILYALTNITYYGTFQNNYVVQMSDEQKLQATTDTITIISKFFEAMQKQNKKFIPNDTSLEASRIILSEPCRTYIQSPSKYDFWTRMQELNLV